MRQVDDRETARSCPAGWTGKRLGSDRREVALAARHVDAVIEELHLGLFRPPQQQGRIERIAVDRRQVAQK
jgi:hypothetical protein